MLCNKNVCIKCHERLIRRDMSLMERESVLELMEEVTA